MLGCAVIFTMRLRPCGNEHKGIQLRAKPADWHNFHICIAAHAIQRCQPNTQSRELLTRRKRRKRPPPDQPRWEASTRFPTASTRAWLHQPGLCHENGLQRRRSHPALKALANPLRAGPIGCARHCARGLYISTRIRAGNAQAQLLFESIKLRRRTAESPRLFH